ncbi:MAG: DUF5916 domain-containing protein [Armatimonadota bacterium]
MLQNVTNSFMNKSLLVVLGGIISISAYANASDVVPTIKATKLEKAPIIDGKLDPAEWQSAGVVNTFLDRSTGGEPNEPTQAWLAYTKKGIFLAFYCKDKEPEKIIGREVIPNSEFKGEDIVSFGINAFGNRTFSQLNQFTVNVRGTKSEKIAGGRTDKREWRGEWKAATSVVSDGWICEIEIPWEMLNLPSKNKLNMDINLVRTQGRTQNSYSWANARQNPLPELQGIWEDVEPPAPPKAKLQLLGYTAPELDHGILQNRMGLDARYAFTPSVTGVMSFAPDFKNIQDVVPGIDFVHTERFLSESRPFFSEGSGFFQAGDSMGGFGSMFYSRRITDFDMATKVYGQATPSLAFGALYTNKFEGDKAAVFNVNKTLSPTSNVGLFGTTSATGKENSSIGMSYNRRTGPLGFNFSAAMENDKGSKSDTAGTFGMSYQGNGDFLYAQYMWITPEFKPALALIPWTDRKGGYLYYGRERRIQQGSIRDVRVNLSTSQFRTYDGVLQENGFNGSYNVGFKNDIGIGVAKVRYTYSGVLDDYTVVGTGLNVSNRQKQFAMNYQWGTQNGLPSNYYIMKFGYRLVKNLDLTINKSVRELAGTARQTVGTLAYQISPQDLISSRYVMRGNNQNLFFSYRHAGFKGAEYYLIYGDPNALRTSNRISIKAVWAF